MSIQIDPTPHFPLGSLIGVGPHVGIDNTPPLALAGNARKLAQKLEQARAILSRHHGGDCPIRVSYAYRCPELNAATKGSDTSAHLEFLAADTVPRYFTLREAFDILSQDDEFMRDVDQLIIERGCLHVGLATARHGGIPRHELRLDGNAPDGHRIYPLFGHWTPQGVVRA